MTTHPPTPQKQDKTMKQLLLDARESIGLLSSHMKVVMTDGSDGDEFQAVSMGVVNTWFDILDKKAVELSLSISQARKEERERAAEIIREYVDGEPCKFDHHGHCQTHNWMSSEKCINIQAKEYLEALSPKDGGKVYECPKCWGNEFAPGNCKYDGTTLVEKDVSPKEGEV